MTATESWSYSAGEKGRNRVRAFEDDKTGIVFLEFYEAELGAPSRKRTRVSTGHRDRDKAKQQADELAARIAKQEPPPSQELTLRALFDIYVREVTPEKGDSKRKHDKRCAEMFLRFFGASRKPSTLNRRDWDRFVNERRRGNIHPAGSKKGREVGSRVIAYDLKWLLGVLNWATLSGDGRGSMLLDRNPLKGLHIPKEENPRRPLLPQARYEAMLAVADQVAPRLRLALVLAHETGHRIGSIRQLRWSDVDIKTSNVRWRAENDKLGREHRTPLTETAVNALQAALREDPGLGDAWVFPAPGDPSKPFSRHLVRDWWNRAEELAELPRVPQMGWHSLRRKFATELKGASLKDLCGLGGWRNPQTVIQCYQQDDEAHMRDALANRKTLVARTG